MTQARYDMLDDSQVLEEDIEIIELKFLRGPNIHTLFPVMEAKIDLGPWVDIPSNPELAKKLAILLPELETHRCSYEQPGGFLKRLNEGTYPAHMIEHCILSIQNTLGSSVSYGKARHFEGSQYMIVTDFEVEQVASSALKFSVELINTLLKNRESWEEIQKKVKKSLDDMKRSALLEERIGPSTAAIIRSAKERNIPYRKVFPKYSLYYLGWGEKKKAIWGPVTSMTSSVASDIVQDKVLCKRILEDYGLPVPIGDVVTDPDEAVKSTEKIGYPVVIKPKSGNHGKGVMVDIRNEEEVKEAFKISSYQDRNIMVEEYIEGEDYRFLIIDNKVVAVAKRIPASVVGDGVSNISQLIKKTNLDPRRANGHISYLSKIKINEEIISYLTKHGLDLNTVPKKGEPILLRGNANLSTGGTAEDYTDKIHPSFKYQLERASRILNMDLVGIDIVTKDITTQEDHVRWSIIEANASPGFRMHLSPNKGEQRQVGKFVIDRLFPQGNGRIPVIAVTGTNGKTTTTRLIDWMIRSHGGNTGMAVTGGIYIKGHKIFDGDTTGPWSAQTVLQDPGVEYAVLETARGGIIKRGLGFDRCSVSVVTNIREDHVGIDDIRDIEDIFWIKSVLVEATEEEGYCVINVKDDFAERLLERARGKPVLFSVEKNQLTTDFIERGESVYLWEDDELVFYEGMKRHHIIYLDEAKFLMGGVKMLVENALAATAAAHCSGIPLYSISSALRSFEFTEGTNPGRLNAYLWKGRTVLLDYAHNPHALDAVGEYVSTMKSDKRIVVFAGVGDRRDKDLINCGKSLCEHFDDIIIAEYPEQRRGRKSGEVSRLIKEGVNSDEKDPILIDDMNRAVSYALKNSKEGDLIALIDLDYTYENLCDVISKSDGVKDTKPKEIKSRHLAQ